MALCYVWWHTSATRYKIAIMIILENYRDKTNFPGNIIEIAKGFTITISRYFCYHLFYALTFTIYIIRYGFGSSLPYCTAKNFPVHPNGDFSINRYREAGRTMLPRCQFRGRMRNNQHKIF